MQSNKDVEYDYMIKRTDKEWDALYDDIVISPLWTTPTCHIPPIHHPSSPIPTMTTVPIHAHPSNPIDIRKLVEYFRKCATRKPVGVPHGQRD